MTQPRSLKSRTVSNISATAVTVAATNITQFATSIILARVLVAADYGIVGYAQILINFLMQFADFGLNSALIQRGEVDEDAIYSGLSLKLVLSLGALLAMVAISPLSGYLLNDRNISTVMKVLSVNFLLSVFSFLPQVFLMRELQYRKLVVPQTAGILLGAATSIGMAFHGYGFWSLVAGNVVNNGSTALLLNLVRPVRYRLCFDRAIVRDLARFGWNMVLPGFIIFVIMNADNFIVGSMKGALALGYYTLAFNWGSMICTILAGVVHRVLFPTFSRLQHDVSEIKAWYLKSLKYVAFIAVPVNVGLLAVSREFLVLVLGKGTDRWLMALAPLQILCFYGIARALLEPVGNVIAGMGKPQLFVRAASIAGVVEVICVLFAVKLSSPLAWVATAVLVAYLTQYLIYYQIMKKEIQLSLGEFAGALSASFLSALGMCGCVMAAKEFVPFSLAGLGIQIALGVLSYAALYAIFDRCRVYKEFRELVIRRG